MAKRQTKEDKERAEFVLQRNKVNEEARKKRDEDFNSVETSEVSLSLIDKIKINGGEWTDNFIKIFFYLCVLGGVFFAIINFGFDIKNVFFENTNDTDKNISSIVISEINKDSIKFEDNQLNIVKEKIEYYTQKTKNKSTANIIYEIKQEPVFFNDKQLKLIKVKLNEYFNKHSISKENAHDIKLLKFIEHIFIYLIPLLIFLGFFNYYKINYSPKFTETTDNNKTLIDDAKDSIQLTKTLFLSSMMAYVIIKIIEKLFLSGEDIKIEKLIAYGVFLFLLMFYLIFSHK